MAGEDIVEKEENAVDPIPSHCCLVPEFFGWQRYPRDIFTTRIPTVRLQTKQDVSRNAARLVWFAAGMRRKMTAGHDRLVSAL